MLGAPPRSYVCDGKIANAQIPTFVVAYNAMHNRLNYTLPVTLEYITQVGTVACSLGCKPHLLRTASTTLNPPRTTPSLHLTPTRDPPIAGCAASARPSSPRELG